MASVLGIASSALKNFNPTASVLAGGGASLFVFAVGCALVAAGISIPVLNVPITMTMVAAAAPTIGHLVTALVPDTLNQQINALAKKLCTSASNLKAVIPQVYSAPSDYPDEQAGKHAEIPSTNNLTVAQPSDAG